MADLAPVPSLLTFTSPSAPGTPPTLASLAAHIADALPTALERSLKLEVENSIMCDRCAELRMRADILQRTIRLERDRQASLRGQIAKLKGPQAPVDKDGGVRERKWRVAVWTGARLTPTVAVRAALGPRDTNSETPTGEVGGAGFLSVQSSDGLRPEHCRYLARL